MDLKNLCNTIIFFFFCKKRMCASGGLKGSDDLKWLLKENGSGVDQEKKRSLKNSAKVHLRVRVLTWVRPVCASMETGRGFSL